MNDSDSDDNVPLSKLRTGISVKQEPVVKREPIPATNGASAAAVATATSIKREASVDSDSDDNVPISSLAQRQKRIKVKPIATSQSQSNANSRPSTSTSTRAPPSKKKRMTIKFKQQECTEELYGTLKGRLVQELLCRWWYVIEWPPADMQPPKFHGLQELDGFRGTYIRVKGDDMGSIVETRPQIGKPSFIHFFAMPSTDIQKLLLKAYEKQMEVLTEHEGSDAPMLKELKSAHSSAAKISPEKAERSVTKLLKKYKELVTQIQEIQEKALQGENTGTEEEDDGATGDDDEDEDDVDMDAAQESAENTNGEDDDDE